jgi:selenocysteine lyase/cysteine desulfurase
MHGLLFNLNQIKDDKLEDYSCDFGPFTSTWINASHQGPLPKRAVAALQEAIQWKVSPNHLADSTVFSSVPARLKEVLGRLINAPSEDIILGNSASYGLHLLANGIRFSPGDEILLVEGDFPCTILPWLNLEKMGVKIRPVKPKGYGLEPEDVLENIGDKTKLLCTSWVYSFTGHMIDLPAISRICRDKGVILILNSSQAIGTQPFDAALGLVDALTNVGFKWLCGPYGTGFCWINPELREDLDYDQTYWLSMQTADDLKSSSDWPEIKEGLGARKYDVFGTANFFNFVPWTESVTYILEKGVKNIKSHNEELINRLREELSSSKYEILTPKSDSYNSTILVISHKDKSRNTEIFEKLKKNNIYISLRRNHMRLAPHLYNTSEDIDKSLDVLNSV